MVKIAAQSGDETADVTPELAVALSTAMGGDPGAQGFASGALAQNSDPETQPGAERPSPMPAASPMPKASALPAASPIPPATSLPGAPRRSEAPR
jgi:hypothetical protein